MSKYKQVLKERKTVSAWRFQKLAGILKEEVEPELVQKARGLTKMWLSAGGTKKVAEWLEKNLAEYFRSGEHESGDEEGMYYVPPSEQEYADGHLALERFLEDIVVNADPELKNAMLEGESPTEVYDAMAQELEMVAKKMFDDIVEDAKYAAGDAREYARDPYAYYGVKRSDFF